MPVTATNVPDVLRVSFAQRDGDFEQAEVVCFVRHDGQGGIELNYSHHVFRSRPVPHGPWDENKARQSLSPALTSLLRTGTMLELWSTFVARVRVLPAPLDAELSEVQW